MVSKLTLQFHQLWRYRELASELFWTYLRLRHVGSVLGFIWTLVNPLLFIATYWFVFSFVVRMGIENYPLYLIPGYLAWNFTFNAIINSSESILQSKYLITKIAFPNEIIVLASIAVSFVDFTLSLLLFLLAIFIFSNVASITLVLVPLIIIIQILFTIGFSLIVATGSVYFKDIPKLIPILGNIIFFLTPIFYPINFIPENLQNVVLLNPLALIVMLFHDTMYYQKVPDPEIFTIAALVSTLVFLAGFTIFNKFKNSFAELS